MAILRQWDGTAWVNVVGTPGPQGVQGVKGDLGWSPVWGIVSDGERRVLQVTNWTGGSGLAPAINQFIGPTGFVATAAEAIDIRGPQGPAGTETLGATIIDAKGDLIIGTAADTAARLALGAEGQIAVSRGGAATGVVWENPIAEPHILSMVGDLAVVAGKSRVYLERDYVVESIRASVNTAPAGASVIVDVNVNGATIFTDQLNRPTIAAAAFTALANLGTGTTTALAAGQYITVDVDQVGSTTAGSDLTVVIRLRRV